ncbi:MAG: fluoride efflux transporter CrcB [Lysinibacillus sp.]
MMAVMIGGCFGAMARFSIGKLLARTGGSFPFPTLCINVLGSFLLGIAVASELSPTMYRLVGIGFLGAFTTFSTFSYETLQLFHARRPVAACLYGAGSIVLGFAAFLAGTFM